MRAVNSPSLIIHNFKGAIGHGLARDLRHLVRGVEVDAYIADVRISHGSWLQLASRFGDVSSPEAVAEQISAAGRESLEFYLDIKCPFSHEETALAFLAKLADLVDFRTADGLFIISRNHRLMASLSDRFDIGLIVGDGLRSPTEYLRSCSSRAIITPALFLFEELIVELENYNIRVITFPPPNLGRLSEAIHINPHRIMIDLDLFEEGAGTLYEYFKQFDATSFG